MKSKVNTEGMEVNEAIIDAFKKFKQGAILEKSYFRAQHVSDLEMQKHLKPEVSDEIIKRQMIQNLAQEFWNNFGDCIVVEEKRNHFGTIEKVYSFDGLVMPLKDFKHAVEFTIKIMPQEKIDEIKK